MFVTVKLYGTLRRLSLPETPGLWKGEVPAGINVRELINFLGTREGEVANAAINGEVCPLDTLVPENAVVILVTPVGGGCG
jgi:sulfur carrier protein ThiS